MSLFSELETLGELMADNLEQQGVSADASDGLTTLANKILDISGGSCYHIELSEHSVTTTGSFTISATLQENYQPKSGATVTFTGGISTVTATTDSNGVATATVTFNQSGTLTATYQGVSDTATITVQSYLFYDDCTSDRTSDYQMITLSGWKSPTMVYDSTNQRYNLSTGNDGNGGYLIKNLVVGDAKLTMEAMATSSGNIQLGIGLYNNDANYQITPRILKVNNTMSILKIGSGESALANASQTISQNTWYKIEFIKNDNALTFNLYNSSGTLLKTLSATSTLLSTTNNTPFIYVSYSPSQTGAIREIKVEAL